MKLSTLNGRAKADTEKAITGDELLALCDRERQGEITITALATTKRNGFWKVIYHENKRD